MDYRADLEGGETELLEINVYGVVKLKEFEDEGSGYFLDVGEQAGPPGRGSDGFWYHTGCSPFNRGT